MQAGAQVHRAGFKDGGGSCHKEVWDLWSRERARGQEAGLGGALALSLVSCVALGKLRTLSVSSFLLGNRGFMIPASWDCLIRDEIMRSGM